MKTKKARFFAFFALFAILSSAHAFEQGVPQCNFPKDEIITDIRTGRTIEVPRGACDQLDWAVNNRTCRQLAAQQGYDCYELTFSSKGTSYCYGCFK